MLIGSYQSFGTGYSFHHRWPCMTVWPPKMGPIGFPKEFIIKNWHYITSQKSKRLNYTKVVAWNHTCGCVLYIAIMQDFSFVFRYSIQCIHISPFWSTFKNHKIFDTQYVNLTNVLSTTHKHMQHSPDGQPQIFDYISLLVAEINFLLLHYSSSGNKFNLLHKS